MGQLQNPTTPPVVIVLIHSLADKTHWAVARTRSIDLQSWQHCASGIVSPGWLHQLDRAWQALADAVL